MKKVCIALLLLCLLFSVALASETLEEVSAFPMPEVSEAEEEAFALLDSAYVETEPEAQLALVREAVQLAPDSESVLVTAAFMLEQLYPDGSLNDEYEQLLRQAYALSEGEYRAETLQLIAEHLLNTDRAEEALSLVREALEGAPQDAALRMLLAMTLYYSGENDESLTLLEAIVEDAPDNAEALALRAAIIMEECRWDDAIQAYTQLKTNFPEYTFGLQGLYMTYAACGQFEKAVRTLDELIRVGGDDSLFIDRARLHLYRLRDPQRALREADAIIRSDPEGFDGYLIAISALVAMEEYEKAGEYADELAAIDSDYGILMHSLIAQDEGRWAEAERLQRSVLQREPEHAFAHYCLSITLLRGHSDAQAAMESLASSYAITGADDGDFYLRLSDIAEISRNPLEAARAYEEAISLTFDDPAPLLSLFYLYLETGREQDMLDTLDRLEKQYPGWLETLYAHTLANDALGNAEEAFATFQLLKDKFPFSAGNMVTMEGILLAATGDANGPQLILENMRLKAEETASMYNDLGVAYLLLGDLDNAEAALEKAQSLLVPEELSSVLSTRRTQSYIFANLSEISLMRGDADACLDFLESAVEYGLYPTTLSWVNDFSEVFATARGQALLSLFPSPDEPWDLDIPPRLPGE